MFMSSYGANVKSRHKDVILVYGTVRQLKTQAGYGHRLLAMGSQANFLTSLGFCL